MMWVNTLKQCIRWTAINLACLTMVFSPVAMGREAEALNEKVLQTYLQEFGLTGKKVTLSEFWEKTKAYYPQFVQKDMEKFVQENPGMLMPEITVTNAKATDGTAVPVLRVTAGGKTTTIQFFGEKSKWAKYNNVVLSEEDLRNVGDTFRRIEASDIRLKKESDNYFKNRDAKANKQKAEDAKYLEKVVKDFARFKGFPRVSPAQWKMMTPQQRAEFIVNMRILWKDARQVLRLEEMNAAAAAQDKKKPAKGKKYSSFEEFSRILLGEPAEAAGVSSSQGGSGVKPQLSRKGESVVKPGAASAPAAPQSKKCIVAGYVSEEGKGTNYAGQSGMVCSEAMVFQSEKYNRNTPEMKMVREAKFDCQAVSANHVACNPLIYGYDRTDGNAICVDRTQKTPNAPAAGNFQKATWWDGPCDSASKLTSEQITQDGMKSTDKEYKDDQKRFDEQGNIKAEVAQKQINLVEENQFKNDSYSQTKAYLDSILLHKKNKGNKVDYTIDALIKGDKPWSKEIDDMLVEIQTQFEVEIGEAIQSCEKSITRKDNVDKNQKGACDQLHRRWLFTERFISQFRAKSCLGGSTYIWELDASKMSKDQIDNAKLNKEKTKSDSELMCQCKSDPNKKVKFNDDKGCGAPDLPAGVKCPEGMDEVVAGFCTCKDNGAEYIPMAEALNRVSSEGIEKVCTAKPESACGKPEGIEGYDYAKCECTKGDLKDENEQGFISKLFNGKQERTPKWVCKESNLWPWILGGLGIAALIAIFHRHKRDPKPPIIPPQSCAPKVGTYPNCVCATGNTCVPGQQIYDTSTCQCTNVPEAPKCQDGTPAPAGNLLSCPKCPDGSYRTGSSAARPGGCPQTNEGGTGTPTCTNPPCSGGVPTGQ